MTRVLEDHQGTPIYEVSQLLAAVPSGPVGGPAACFPRTCRVVDLLVRFGSVRGSVPKPDRRTCH